MKNKNKLFGLLLAAGLALTGCGGDNGGDNGNGNGNYNGNQQSGAAKSDWSDKEKGVISTNLYNATIPYMYVADEVDLTYDEEGEYAFKTAPTCTEETLKAYADKFDDSWDDYSEPDYYYYCFEKFFDTPDGKRAIDVSFYTAEYVEGEDGNYYEATEENTGCFYLEIYDPYYYSWPENDIAEFLMAFYEMEAEVPAFNGANYYELSTSYLYEGVFALYCYTDDATSEDKYIAALTAAGWTENYEEYDGESFTYYLNATEELAIQTGYDPDYKDLDVYIYYNESEVDDDGGNTGTHEELNIPGDAITAKSFGSTFTGSSYISISATGESGAEYSGVASAASGIQINNKSDKGVGIVVTKSVGYVERIGFEFDSACLVGKTINVYGSKEPFTVADMYSGAVKLIGTASTDNSTAIVEFDEEYAYVGFISSKNVINISKIVFSWVTETPVEGGEGQQGEGGQAGEGQQGEGGQAGEGQQGEGGQAGEGQN